MAIENINDYAGMWANGVNIGQLWDKIKEKFVSGAHVQSDATTYPASWKQQARANIGLTIGANKMWYGSAANTIGEVTTTPFGRGLLNTSSGTEITGLFAETAEKDKNGIEISENYAHSLAITDGYLRLKNNRYVSGTASAQDLSALQLNVKLGLLQLDNTGSAGKIPLVHIPDSIMGQLTYGGTITAYTQSTDSLTVSITTGAKAILEQKTGRTIGNKTVKLVATASDPSDTSSIAYFNYTDCTGIYFIWTADALETHTGEPDYRVWPSGGPRYQAGDWLISNDTKWDKVDNTDAVTGVKGSNESAFRLGNVSIDALDVRALATYLTNTTQTVADKVQFNKDIWSLGGVAAYGISDLSAGGGGGGGLSGTIIRNWSNYQGAETEVLGANLGMRGFRMSGYSFQVNKPAVGADNWQTEFTLGTENIPDLPLTQITGTDDLQAIEALTATSGFLKKTKANTWALQTLYAPTSGGTAGYVLIGKGTTTAPDWTSDIFVDATNHRVGIGTTSPAYKFQVDGASYFSGGVNVANESLNFITTGNATVRFARGTDGVPFWYNGSVWSKILTAENIAGTTVGATTRVDNLNADLLDGYEANGLFESLTNDNDQLKIQIGNTSKLLTLDYAKKTSRMRTEIKADQEFVYRQSPQTIDADSLVINKFKGRTVAWNQRIKDWQGGTSGAFNCTNCSVSYSGGISTFTGSSGNSSFLMTRQGVAAVVDHKYYHFIVYKSTVGVQVYECGGTGAFSILSASDSFVTYSGVALNNYASGTAGFGFYINGATSSWTVQIKYMCSVDLTLMYGSGNEPTAAEFKKYFEGAFPYNQGELINNDAKEVETVGFNLWDEEWELGSINTSTGENQSSDSYYRTKNFIPVIAGESYYFYCPTSSVCPLVLYDSNKRYVGVISSLNTRNQVSQIPSGVSYVRSNFGGSVYSGDICFNISDTAKNGTYEPYRRIVTDLNLGAIQVKSHNIWDEEWIKGGDYSNSGSWRTDSHMFSSKNLIPIEPLTSYYHKFDAYGYIYYYDVNKNYISTYTTTAYSGGFSSPSNARYMHFSLYYSGGAPDYNNNICINESSSFNGQYEPHGILTINGLKQAGSVYDEIVGKKFIQRVGSVDLGTLTWLNVGSTYAYFQARPDGNPTNNTFGLIIPRYTDVGIIYDAGTSQDKVYARNTGLIRIRDTAYNSTSAFKTAMSGVMLNYELATPIEYELASPIPDTMPAGTTERIISDRLPVTPFACDMTYGANPKDILASAVPFSRLQGVRLERGAFTMSTQNDSNWYLVTLGDKKLYLRFTVNTGAFKLEMASDDTENPEYSKSFEFATLSTADINAICV